MDRHRSTHLLVVLLAMLALSVGLLAAPASAATGGKIKGVVTLAGSPLKGAKVKLMRTDTDSGDAYQTYKTATTDSRGRYSFSASPLKGWTYDRVIVTDPQHRAVSTVRSLSGRSTKTVTRNVTMKRAGSITGKITRADGSAPTATRVQIQGPSIDLGPAGNERLAYDDDRGVSANGTYRFVGLPAGTYAIQYDDTTTKYLIECYDDIVVQGITDYYCEDATQVTVKGGAESALAPQQLDHPGAHIRGIVTNTSGTPLRDIVVTPYRAGTSADPWYEYVSTRSTGRFSLGPVGSGNWQFKIEDFQGVWESRWYDSASRAGAEVFTLAEGTVVKDLAIKLKSKATVSVKVKPGTRRATFNINVFRRATGSRPSGKVTVSLGDISRTATVTKGIAKVTLTGLSAGKRTFRVDYRGTVSTADAHRNVSATIR